MSHFYGTVQGARGQVSRTGGKVSGITTYAASYSGAARCFAYINEAGVDCVRVTLATWEGAGINRLLYDGPLNGS